MDSQSTSFLSIVLRGQIADYFYLTNSEDRLMWLLERELLFPVLEESERTSERQIKECVSGLWLKLDKNESIETNVLYRFQAYSGSQILQATVSFICDILSEQPASVVRRLEVEFIPSLHLEDLFSTNRRVAIATVRKSIIRLMDSTDDLM